MRTKLEGLVELITQAVTAIVSGKDAKECLGERRVVIIVDKAEVKTKIVVPIVREKKPSRLAPEFIQRIQEAKKTLKGKRDAMYLFTLLMSLSSELKKMKMSTFDTQSLSIIAPAMNAVEQELIKQMEVK
jgi:hypothetical protein